MLKRQHWLYGSSVGPPVICMQTFWLWFVTLNIVNSLNRNVAPFEFLQSGTVEHLNTRVLSLSSTSNTQLMMTWYDVLFWLRIPSAEVWLVVPRYHGGAGAWLKPDVGNIFKSKQKDEICLACYRYERNNKVKLRIFGPCIFHSVIWIHVVLLPPPSSSPWLWQYTDIHEILCHWLWSLTLLFNLLVNLLRILSQITAFQRKECNRNFLEEI